MSPLYQLPETIMMLPFSLFPKSLLVAGITVLGALVFILAALSSCSGRRSVTPGVTSSPFGRLPDGRVVDEYVLTSSNGMSASIITYGAAVRTLFVPDRSGAFADVVLGYDSLDGYVNDRSYFGAIVGRYGNRIGKGTFVLDGTTHHLATNDGENHLHGGMQGFNKVVWTAEVIRTSPDPAVAFTYVSRDGEEGYPGTVTLTVTYTLTIDLALRIDYSGTTDKPTILNPTHHSYFNLTGDPRNTILEHQLMISSDSITPVDKGLIPTGAMLAVAGTPMDLRKATAVGAHIDESFEQLVFGKGYDHNWVLKGHDGTVRRAAVLSEPTSGRTMTVLTDQPGLQFYSGNFLDGSVRGKAGVSYAHRTALCLEAQHFPDSPNRPGFPSVVLRPGMTYHQTTFYQFSTR